MRIETERLILRRFEERDFEDLFEYLSDAEVLRFEPYKPMTREEARENLKWRISAEEMIAVERKEDGKLIGNLYLSKNEFGAYELGYVFSAKAQKHGYARESARALLKWVFEQGTHRVFAMCDPQNPNSWKLLEALGFTREAHLRKNAWFWKDESGAPIWKDTYIYGLLNTDEVK